MTALIEYMVHSGTRKATPAEPECKHIAYYWGLWVNQEYWRVGYEPISLDEIRRRYECEECKQEWLAELSAEGQRQYAQHKHEQWKAGLKPITSPRRLNRIAAEKRHCFA